MLEITGMSKIYKMASTSVTALSDISLRIEDREFVSIVGPSGSGKSTLMNMIGLLDVPSAGSYKLDGQEVSKLNDNKLAEYRNFKIGFIFQRYSLLPNLTALENVELPLIYQGVASKEAKRRAIESLDSIGMKDRMHHKPKELSGGQQQRVAIARALVTKASIILADEPTGALDSKTGGEVMQILKSLNARGNTVILITHDNNLAIQAKRMIRIQDGVIVDDKELV
jgi:ABC-type antimicrobial peptide transport system, ATPase component